MKETSKYTVEEEIAFLQGQLARDNELIGHIVPALIRGGVQHLAHYLTLADQYLKTSDQISGASNISGASGSPSPPDF